jgi:electron transport complex protein RnfC
MKVLRAAFRFRGGVHPPAGKERTASLPLRELPLPARLVVSTSQHLGAPARPCVKVGDDVRAGQLLAEAAGMISAPVHAPAAGKVAAIVEAPTPAGRSAAAIVIETRVADPAEHVEIGPPLADWESREAPFLLERIAAAGIVGMGGAGFPTRVKLAPPADKPIDTLIANGAECEPCLSGDHRLMVERAREIWEGCRIARHILGARTLRVAIEDNKPDAIRAMSEAMREAEGDVAVVVLPSRYPQGGEKQLIFSVAGRVVPAGGLPMDVGCVVVNVGTALAVREAVVRGRPLTARSITVAGDAVAAPANWLAPAGTTFADLAAACGGTRAPVAKIVAGGPMMGFAASSPAVAMDKTTSGLLLLSPARATVFRPWPCIGCGRCARACPMRLLPSELSQAGEADDIELAERLHVMDCFECGACAYECPARRPLVQHVRRLKAVVAQRRRESRQAAPKE